MTDHKELNKAYPKFFTYDYSQQKYIEDLSLSQDKTLGNLASKVRQMPKRTKGINPEDAFSFNKLWKIKTPKKQKKPPIQ